MRCYNTAGIEILRFAQDDKVCAQSLLKYTK